MVSTELNDCVVCKVSGVNDTETSCHPSLALVPEEEVKLLFNCSQPVDQAFTVMIIHTIGETASLLISQKRSRTTLFDGPD